MVAPRLSFKSSMPWRRANKRRSNKLEPHPQVVAAVPKKGQERARVLPPEILWMIFENLSHTGDFFNCLMVCRSWYEVASADAFWKNLDLTSASACLAKDYRRVEIAHTASIWCDPRTRNYAAAMTLDCALSSMVLRKYSNLLVRLRDARSITHSYPLTATDERLVSSVLPWFFRYIVAGSKPQSLKLHHSIIRPAMASAFFGESKLTKLELTKLSIRPEDLSNLIRYSQKTLEYLVIEEVDDRVEILPHNAELSVIAAVHDQRELNLATLAQDIVCCRRLKHLSFRDSEDYAQTLSMILLGNFRTVSARLPHLESLDARLRDWPDRYHDWSYSNIGAFIGLSEMARDACATLESIVYDTHWPLPEFLAKFCDFRLQFDTLGHRPFKLSLPFTEITSFTVTSKALSAPALANFRRSYPSVQLEICTTTYTSRTQLGNIDWKPIKLTEVEKISPKKPQQFIPMPAWVG